MSVSFVSIYSVTIRPISSYYGYVLCMQFTPDFCLIFGHLRWNRVGKGERGRPRTIFKTGKKRGPKSKGRARFNARKRHTPPKSTNRHPSVNCKNLRTPVRAFVTVRYEQYLCVCKHAPLIWQERSSETVETVEQCDDEWLFTFESPHTTCQNTASGENWYGKCGAWVF